MVCKYVYDRLLFELIFSLDFYKEFFRELGFMVLVIKDLKEYLNKSYELLFQLVLVKYLELSVVYDQMCKVIKIN